MRRLSARAVVGLFAIVVATGAAAPTTTTTEPPATVVYPAQSSPGNVFAPAPVPDLDLDGSMSRKTDPAKVGLSPTLYHQHPTLTGEGYTPNSTMDGEQTRRFLPMPGLNLNVPLP